MANRRQEGGSSSYPPPPSTASRIYIGNKAKEILATPDITGITKLVSNLCYGKETEQSSPSSKLLFDTFTYHFPNILAVKLLQIYRFATDTKNRSFSLYLFDSLLIDLDDLRVGLKKESLNDIITHLNSCLFERESSDDDFKLLSRIVSHVAVDVFIDNKPWEELCSYILSLDENEKALLMFSELPTFLDEEFLMPLLENGLGLKIADGLFKQDFDEKEWCLALEAGFSLMLQLVNMERKSLICDLVYAIMKSVWEMVHVQRREIVVRNFRIAMKVRREALRFRENDYEVVTRLGWMMQRSSVVGQVMKMMVVMIREVLEKYYIGDQPIDMSLFNQFL